MANAREEALDLIQSSNRLIEKTIKDIRETQADKQRTKELRKKVEGKAREIQSKAENEKKKKSSVTKPKIEERADSQPFTESTIKVGDIVQVPEQNIKGDVISVNEDEVVIAFNSISIKTKLSKVKKVGDKSQKGISKKYKSSYSGILNDMNDKLSRFKLQLDVRGKRGEEALEMVRQYIDDAILLNIREVRILHGKGYGILRNLIHEYLQSIPEIIQFKDEHIERGGHGITIVILK